MSKDFDDMSDEEKRVEIIKFHKLLILYMKKKNTHKKKKRRNRIIKLFIEAIKKACAPLITFGPLSFNDLKNEDKIKVLEFYRRLANFFKSKI